MLDLTRPRTSDEVYVSGALTNAKLKGGVDPRELYKLIGDLCRRKGLNPYVPHLHTDPVLHKDIHPTYVYEMDHQKVLDACLLIAYVGQASGVLVWRWRWPEPISPRSSCCTRPMFRSPTSHACIGEIGL